MANMSKEHMLDELRRMFRESLRRSGAGGGHASQAHALGKVDGFMLALLSAGIADERELLSLVAEERQRYAGPATAELAPDEQLNAAA